MGGEGLCFEHPNANLLYTGNSFMLLSFMCADVLPLRVTIKAFWNHPFKGPDTAHGLSGKGAFAPDRDVEIPFNLSH